MKKLILLLFVGLCSKGFAQITLENTYTPSTSSFSAVRVIHLSNSGYKYALYETNRVKLFNLDHTLWKSISYAALGTITTGPWVWNISEALFNTDSSNVEVLLTYTDGSSVNNSAILAEDGTIIENFPALEGFSGNIFYTSSGTKLVLLSGTGDYKSYIYSLPGSLTCEECQGGTYQGISGNVPNTEKGMLSDPIPNPNNGQVRINYTLPPGVSSGEIVFFNLQGFPVKNIKVTKATASITTSTESLAAGIYFYQLNCAECSPSARKMIVIK